MIHIHGLAAGDFREVAVNDGLGAVERYPGFFRRSGRSGQPARHLNPGPVAQADLHRSPHSLAVDHQVAIGLIADLGDSLQWHGSNVLPLDDHRPVSVHAGHVIGLRIRDVDLRHERAAGAVEHQEVRVTFALNVRPPSEGTRTRASVPATT